MAAGFAAAVSAREYIASSAGASDRNTLREYPVVEAVDQTQLALETIEKLTPGTDTPAPPITFALRDSGTVAGALQDMATWQIQIFNSSDKKVGFIQGRGQPPPPALPWSGLSDNGEPLPGGFYKARLVWTNGTKKLYTTQEVSFHLFSRLQVPRFSDLKFDFPLNIGRPLL